MHLLNLNSHRRFVKSGYLADLLVFFELDSMANGTIYHGGVR
jgi:hypothetical protein